MPNFELPDVSFDSWTWGVIANVALSDGNLLLVERCTTDGDETRYSFHLVYAVLFVDLNGEVVRGDQYDHGSSRRNREAARTAFVGRVSDSLWS